MAAVLSTLRSLLGKRASDGLVQGVRAALLSGKVTPGALGRELAGAASALSLERYALELRAA